MKGLWAFIPPSELNLLLADGSLFLCIQICKHLVQFVNSIDQTKNYIDELQSIDNNLQSIHSQVPLSCEDSHVRKSL